MKKVLIIAKTGIPYLRYVLEQNDSEIKKAGLEISIEDCSENTNIERERGLVIVAGHMGEINTKMAVKMILDNSYSAVFVDSTPKKEKIKEDEIFIQHYKEPITIRSYKKNEIMEGEYLMSTGNKSGKELRREKRRKGRRKNGI